MILDTLNFSKIDDIFKNNRIDTILCDIFDTLICRSIHPEQIKRRVSANLSDLFLIPETTLYQRRNTLEMRLYQEAEHRYGDKEFCYDEFLSRYYDDLSTHFPNKIFLSRDSFMQQYKAMELSLECPAQCIDENLVTLLRQQKKQGKKIILLSDFYMASSEVGYFLNYHGLTDLYDHLIVSADKKLTKRSGKLYQYLADQQLIHNPQNALMIGDNSHSDIYRAKQNGLHTYFIQRPQQLAWYRTQAKTANNKKDFQNNIHQLFASRGNPPFHSMALTLLRFTILLYQACVHKKVKKLYFLSREGALLKTLFDNFQQQLSPYPLDTTISTYYLMASRRSTAGASLKPIAQENFQVFFRQYKNVSLQDFFLSYGFDINELQNLCKNNNIDIQHIHSNLQESEDFCKLLQNETFQTIYETHRQNQKAAFQHYLKSLDIDAENNEELALVDVGWKGTIQDNIFATFNTGKKITGFYLGLLSPGHSTPNNEKHGLLFDYRHKNQAFWIYRECCSLFEVLLTAGHGSPISYSNDKEKPSTVILTLDNDETNLFNNKIKPIQDFITTTFNEILKIINNYNFSIQQLDSWFLARHEQMVFNPSKEEITWFTDCFHTENFGVFRKSHFGSNNIEVSRQKTLKNFYQFMRSPRRYINESFWPSLRFKTDGLSLLHKLYKWYLTQLVAKS